MSTYYDYYLEQKTENGWALLLSNENDSESIYYHTRSYGEEFVYNYELEHLKFNEYNNKAREEYRENYENVLNCKSQYKNVGLISYKRV